MLDAVGKFSSKLFYAFRVGYEGNRIMTVGQDDGIEFFIPPIVDLPSSIMSAENQPPTVVRDDGYVFDGCVELEV